MKADRTSYALPHPALSPFGSEGIEPTPSPRERTGVRVAPSRTSGLRHLLEGVAGSEDGAVLPVATDQHHADGKAARRPARHGECRVAGAVEGAGVGDHFERP